jgi:hypothetical protein
MVFELFSSVRRLVKLDAVSIDNNVFRLHYKATVIILVIFSLLVTSSQYFGDPIDCIQRDDIPTNLLDTYCWIHSTFTLPEALNKKVGVEVPHPGIDKYTPGEKRVYHKYYQWVCFVLFLQAIMFYIPRYLWKLWEGGRLRSLVLGLNCPIMQEKEKSEQLQLLVQYLKANWRYHNTYFFYFVICEVLNFINVIIQMYLIDTFLGGAFSSYGLDVLRYTEMDQEQRVDPMIAVFPRMTKCTFHRYGSSGDVQRHDALCILPLNIVNEKIYIFLWFWFVFLAIISGVILIYRAVIILFPQLRYVTLRSRARLTDRYHLRLVMDVSKLGDWFLLYLLCKNMDGQHFRELMQDFSKEIHEDGTGKSLLSRHNEKETLSPTA